MVIAKPTTRLTYQDYANTPDDERWELIGGELIMAPAPNMFHQTVDMRLGSLLHVFVDDRNLGRVYPAPTDVVLSDVNVVQPDLLFVSNERAFIITSANIQGAPDLVVEILSPSTASRDWTVKLDLYARHGVKEYWLVDPDAQRIWVMLLGADGFDEVGSYGMGDVLTSPTQQGFSANLDDIFRP